MMKKFFLFKKFFFQNFIIKINLFILIIKNVIQKECEISKPIKMTDNNCYLIYCTKEQFDRKECIINNPIIKTQWLTNIINTGINQFRFINFALSSNNDLYLHMTSYPTSQINCFFGISSNGRPKFLKNGESSLLTYIPYKNSSYSTRYHGEMINVIINESNIKKEYIMSIGTDENNFELFDFENKELIIYSTKQMTKYNICSKYFCLLDYFDNNKHYYILSFIGKDLEDNNHYYVLQKYEFIYDSNENDIIYRQTEYMKNINLETNHYKYGLSCFETDKKLIVCFYYNSNLHYTATIYDLNLIEHNNFNIAQPSDNQTLFFNRIHLKK